MSSLSEHDRAASRKTGPTPPEDPPAWREITLAVLALVSILIGISRFENPQTAPAWLQAFDVGIGTAFFLDWAARIRAADRRLRYFFTHSYEMLFFIPFTLLPAEASGGNLLRGARIFRFIRFARYGRYAKLGLAFTRLPRRVKHLQLVAHNAQLVSIFVSGLLTVTMGAAALLVLEGGAAGIHNYPQALWWSLSLFTTVAYAVPDPQTSAGHLVSGILMVGGVLYVGIFTASLASAILRTPEEE